MPSIRPLRSLLVTSLLLVLVIPATAQTPKSGGVLTTSPLSATPSLSPHEESTIATVQQASPCFNNLVYYDPTKKVESADTIIPELAEKWSWQDNQKAPWLVIFPGVAISLAVFGTNLLGDALRDTLDPRLRGA